MAEFCLDCVNKYFDEELTPMEVSMDYDLCEGCGEWKLCVITITKEIEE